MHVQQDISDIRATSRVLTYDQSGETETEDPARALAAFIKQSKETKNEPIQYVDLPNTAPPDSGAYNEIFFTRQMFHIHFSCVSEMVASEQHEVIGWRDPSEVVEDTPKRPSTKNSRPSTKTSCFSISCTNDDLKNKIIKQIKELGGKVCENLVKYDSACTHFVCEKPSRSEKMLSCVAAGKWVLSLSYIQKSHDAKRFLNVSVRKCKHFNFHFFGMQTVVNECEFRDFQEEEFEWGNPKAIELPQVQGNDVNIANAAHRWRKKLQLTVMPASKGIFKDFRVILRTSKDESLRTLIEAGRGQVIETSKK